MENKDELKQYINFLLNIIQTVFDRVSYDYCEHGHLSKTNVELRNILSKAWCINKFSDINIAYGIRLLNL